MPGGRGKVQFPGRKVLNLPADGPIIRASGRSKGRISGQ